MSKFCSCNFIQQLNNDWTCKEILNDVKKAREQKLLNYKILLLLLNDTSLTVLS